MKPCNNSQCTWRFDPTEHEFCPKCGEEAPEIDTRPTAWNSTLKVDPSKRPKRSPIKYKPKSGELAESMRQKARDHLKEHEGTAVCEHCGIPIIEMKYDNISHNLTRGAHPDMALDHENMTVLCCFIDLMLRGEEGQSCHDLWESNDMKGYEGRKDKYR